MSPLRACLFLLLMGCSSAPSRRGTGPEEDAGAGPMPPAPPVLTPCPAGWREVVDASGIATCDPWPESGRGDCGADEAHFPGGAGCEPIGAPCPAGDFAEGLPAGAIHVLAGATGGDGSAAEPFGTIVDALAVATDGDVIALSKGTFSEVVDARGEVTLVGACVAETAIVAPGTSELDASVSLRGSAGMRDVRVGGDRIGIMFDSSRPSTIERVLVEDARVSGIGVVGGVLTADRVVVRGTRASDGQFGIGIFLSAGGTADVRHAVIEENLSEGALVVDPGSALSLADSVVRATEADSATQLLGRGLEAFGGGALSLARVEVEGNRGEGVVALDAGSTLSAVDVVVRGTRPTAFGLRHGYGIELARGATAEISRTWISQNHAVGLLAWDGSAIEATDVVVSDTLPQENDGEGGFGVQVGSDATVHVERVALLRNLGVGLSVFGALDGTDVLVQSTGSRPRDGEAGDGMQARDGAQVSLERAAFDGNRRFGVSSWEAGTRVSLVELRVAGTLAQECEATACDDEGGGSGLAALQGGAIDARRFAISGSVLCGVQVASGGTMDLHEGTVSDNVIGANVQTAGFDTTRLEDQVLWIDNETTLDAALLPIPEPVAELAAN